MARPKGTPKVAVQIYLPEEVHAHLVRQLEGVQSLSSYILQRSGVVKDYRDAMRITPQASIAEQPIIIPTKECETCTLVQCDPSCPLANKY